MTRFQPQFILCNALYLETKSFFWVESQTSLNFSLQWTLQSSYPSLLVTLVIDLQIWVQLYLWSSGQGAMVSAILQASSPAESASWWASVWSLGNDGCFNGDYKFRHSKVGDPSGWKKKKNCWKPPIGYWEEEAQHSGLLDDEKKQVEKLPSCFSHSCAFIVEVLFTSTPIATNPTQEPKLWSRNWWDLMAYTVTW